MHGALIIIVRNNSTSEVEMPMKKHAKAICRLAPSVILAEHSPFRYHSLIIVNLRCFAPAHMTHLMSSSTPNQTAYAGQTSLERVSLSSSLILMHYPVLPS